MSTPKAYDTTPLSTVEAAGCPANGPRGPWSPSRNGRRSSPRDDTTNHRGPVPPLLLLDDVEQGQELAEAREPGRDPDFVVDSAPGSGGMYATGRVEGSSRAMLTTARPSCLILSRVPICTSKANFAALRSVHLTRSHVMSCHLISSTE